MTDFQLTTIQSEPSADDWKIIVDGMLAYHASQGHPRTVKHFSVLLRSSDGTLVGAVTATLLYNGMEIQTMWVDESVRRQGWGRKLLVAAEAQGKKRGAAFSYTNTFSWQAPGFYEKLGYTVYGKLNDFPNGCSLTYYRKDL